MDHGQMGNTPPHRHPGPVFGYVTEGELIYELAARADRRAPRPGA